MKGFIILNNKNGNLVYSRYFNDRQVLSKETGYKNLCFDQQDPIKIANQFFALIKMQEMMVEEYKTEFPDDDDPNTKMSF